MGGGQAKFTPLFRGGSGSERFYSGSGEERGGGGDKKVLRLISLALGFFLRNRMTF